MLPVNIESGPVVQAEDRENTVKVPGARKVSEGHARIALCT